MRRREPGRLDMPCQCRSAERHDRSEGGICLEGAGQAANTDHGRHECPKFLRDHPRFEDWLGLRVARCYTTGACGGMDPNQCAASHPTGSFPEAMANVCESEAPARASQARRGRHSFIPIPPRHFYRRFHGVDTSSNARVLPQSLNPGHPAKAPVLGLGWIYGL